MIFGLLMLVLFAAILAVTINSLICVVNNRPARAKQALVLISILLGLLAMFAVKQL